ncbi:MAG TPA: SRPBCC domain-containing protein [Steroidobacteraceae bacterium]|jgi:uncharacterized protein YndB with AHSA1/START domain|nr:SRPBCC domain-containing protein [Steroidobacteraceae bacterium]HVY81547.1 SRPBCC domain-containing protein [Steroidobacteraceae bacterium]
MCSSRLRALAFSGLVGLFASAAGRAEVTGIGPSGFSLKIETSVGNTPEEVFKRFVQIARWWDPGHTYSGDAANLALTAKPGGCFCETLPGGGFVEHMNVVYAAPGKAIRMTGGLGPLQAMGATGALTFEFKPDGANTRLVVTYNVTGFASGQGFAKVAPAVDSVLAAQVARLTHFAETGKPITETGTPPP